jgi:hypothetical protein
MTPLQNRGERNLSNPGDLDRPHELKHCIALLDDNPDIRFLLRTEVLPIRRTKKQHA